MANPCSEILDKGIWEFTKINRANDLLHNLYQFFNKNTFSKRSTAVTFAESLGLKLPVEGIPIKWNSSTSYDRSKEDTFSEDFLSVYHENTEYHNRFLKENKTASKVIANTWLACQKLFLENGGIRTEIEYTGDKAIVYIYFKRKFRDGGIIPYISKKALKAILKKEKLILQSSHNEKISLHEDGPKLLSIKIPKSELSKPKTFIVPLHGNPNVYDEFQINLPRIIEEPVTWKIAKKNYPVQSVSPNVRQVVTNVNQSKDCVRAEIDALVSFKSIDDGKSGPVTVYLKVSDIYGNILFEGSGTRRSEDRGYGKLILPTQYVKMEPGDEVKLVVESKTAGIFPVTPSIVVNFKC